MIEAIQQYFFTCMITIFTVVYVISKITDEKTVFRKKKTYFVMFAMIILSILNFIYVDNSVRFLVSTLYIFVCSKIIFSKPIRTIITAVILEQSILFVSEMIFMLAIILFLQFNIINIFEQFQGTIITNIMVSLIAIIMINLKYVMSFCNKIINYMENIKQKNKYVLALIFIITLNVLLLLIYINSKNLAMVIINFVFIIIYSFVLFLLLSEKNQNTKFKEENKLLLDNLNEYEKMLDYQRVANHENKNQLLVIKSIASKNNKKLHDYLDEVIKEKREDDETLYNNAKRIPSGGLQGLVYQKMLLMQERNISLELNVSREVRKIELSNLNAKINFDLCRAIGIIIDNSVDECSKLEQKELSISMYNDDDYFIIEIANKCKEIPNMERLDQKGYTTKENGHGYGLCLLKDICDKNKDIQNERKVVEDIFIQIIKVKI